MHVTDWFTTLLRAAGMRPPTDPVIDGVDQLDWLTGRQESSARDGLISWMGPEMYGVKWRDFKLVLVIQKYMTTDAGQRLATPHIINLITDAATRANESTPDGVALVAQLFSTVDQTPAASLRLCHLAIESADRADPVDDWVAYALDQASDALPRVSYTASPPSLISHTEEAARWVAVAIDQAHSDPPAAPRAIADALSDLLVVCVFADVLAGRTGI
jgi:hypothetical protein